MFIFQLPLLRRTPFSLLPVVALAWLGGCVDSRPDQVPPATENPSNRAAPAPAVGGLVGTRSPHETSRADSMESGSPRTWISPSGQVIEDGTVDADGYVLPLDIRRPKAARPEVERPSSLRIDALRRLARGSAFPETRLGPDDGHTENETSIDADGATVVAGWNQFTDASLLQGVARSADSGATWNSQELGGHTTMSDPIVAAGGGDRWYFGYIASGGAGGSDFEVYVRRSVDDGVSWSDPVAVTSNTTFDDKPYMDARGNEVLVAWADFGFSPSKVRAARSLDGGLTFGADTILAVESTAGNGAVPVIDVSGNYYVFWRDSFQQFQWMSKSTDQGANWSKDVSIAPMDPLPSSFPPGFRIVNLPTAAAHPVSGALVMLWNDEAFGDPDILSVRSTDGGDTWSAPIQVNDDGSGRNQFFPWVTFGDDGIAHAVWYDQRFDGSKIDVYMASSSDAGGSWGPNVRITGTAFDPVLPWENQAASFIGDYNGIAASGGKVYPFYQDSREGNQDVWVAVVPSSLVFGDGFESGDISAWNSSSP